MARILVTSGSGLGARALAARLADCLQAEGHDGFILGSTVESPLDAVRDSDAVVALLESDAAGAIACAAFAHALGKPTLALHSLALDSTVAAVFSATQPISSAEEAEAAIQSFVSDVKPYAGRLVRDLVPGLVRDAGHTVQFREADSNERPRYLKRKVSEEARELEAAGPGAEKEEIADLLEALEALLLARGYSRDDLKAVKQAKLRRRGGFERGFIVESAAQGGQPAGVGALVVHAIASAPTLTPPVEAEPEAVFELPNPFAAMEVPVEDASVGAETSTTPEEPDAPMFSFPPLPATAPTTPTPPATLPSSPSSSAPDFSGWPSLQSAIDRSAANEPKQADSDSSNDEPVEFRPDAPGPRRTDLWNLGFGGKREAIKPKVEDPDQVEPNLREI